MARWEKTVDFDKLGVLPPNPWDEGYPGHEVDRRAEWVVAAAQLISDGGLAVEPERRDQPGFGEGQHFVDAVKATSYPRPAHVALTPAWRPVTRGARGWSRRMMVRDFCLERDLRWWCLLRVAVIVDDYDASWLEEGGAGELVATDASGQNPIRFLGRCVTWVLVPAVEAAVARATFQRAVAVGFDPGRSVFARPVYRDCPRLTIAVP